jgi:biotin carboxyl carrier protein
MKPEFKPFLNPPRIILISKIRIMIFLVGLLFLSAFLPWYIFTSGAGRVTAVDPNERIQEINAPVGGFIARWHVKEGSELKRGDRIVELVDADPGLLERLQQELQAARQALEANELALRTAHLNLDRQRQLLKEGLTARKDFERARIEVSKHEVEVSKAQSTVVKAETQVSRQRSQSVVAPRDGKIIRILPGEGNQLVKTGDALVVFAPEVLSPAIELWISGNDVPFVSPGKKARLMFEGWPAVQVPGWPSVAVGTFGAKVHLVDYASSYQGKFRVLLVPDQEPWPSSEFLRLNANARGLIFLRRTLVGIELWRQLNNFPPAQEPIQDELNRMLMGAKEKEKAREDKARQIDDKETEK